MEFTYLGSNLRFFRQLLGFSQHELAERASATGLGLISQNDVSRLELGQRPSDVGHVTILARALDVTPDDLLRRPRVRRSASGLRAVVIAHATRAHV